MKTIFALIIFAFINPITATDNSVFDNTNSIQINDQESIQPITCRWFFTTTDSLNNKKMDIDTSKWDLLPIEYPWNGNKKYNNHYTNVWFRLPIYIENNIRNIALYIPIHYRGAQFYFNEKLIYESRHYDDAGNSPPIAGKPCIIKIPNRLLIKGYNILSIRTRMLDNTSGFSKPLYIGSIKKISSKYYFSSSKTYAICAVSLFIALYFLFYFLYLQSERYYLYMSIFSLGMSIWMIGYTGHSLYIIDSRAAYNLLTYIGSILCPIGMTLFINSFLNIKKNIIRAS